MRNLINKVRRICKSVYPSKQVEALEEIEQEVETFLSRTPQIICLCGSTRFMEEYQRYNEALTLDGKIVLTVGCFRRTYPDGKRTSEEEIIKQNLDELHKRKIDLADEIFVLNVNGYIGESTRSEIEYAEANGKKVSYLEMKF